MMSICITVEVAQQLPSALVRKPHDRGKSRSYTSVF
jgi:hypothetical protein